MLVVGERKGMRDAWEATFETSRVRIEMLKGEVDEDEDERRAFMTAGPMLPVAPTMVMFLMVDIVGWFCLSVWKDSLKQNEMKMLFGKDEIQCQTTVFIVKSSNEMGI